MMARRPSQKQQRYAVIEAAASRHGHMLLEHLFQGEPPEGLEVIMRASPVKWRLLRMQTWRTGWTALFARVLDLRRTNAAAEIERVLAETSPAAPSGGLDGDTASEVETLIGAAAVTAISGLSSAAVHILALQAFTSGLSGGDTPPRTLARLMNKDIASVRRGLAELEAAGWTSVTRRQRAASLRDLHLPAGYQAAFLRFEAQSANSRLENSSQQGVSG